MAWKQEESWMWTRCDGAQAIISDLADPKGKRWIGVGPVAKAVMRRKNRVDKTEWKTPERRFSCAQTAMIAIDKEYPLQGFLI